MIAISSDLIEDNIAGFYIPPKPEILVSVQELINSEDPNLFQLAELISADIGLSGAILKAANSPSYGMSREVLDIKHAVCMLGFNSINLLVSSFLLKKAFPATSCLSLERFWDDSTEIANIMTFVAIRLGCDIPAENLYSFGLFRNCGIPAMAIKYPNYKEVLIQANASLDESQIELENKHFDTNHAVVGYFIASSWNLPKPLCDLVLQHHERDYLDHEKNPISLFSYAILKLSENIVSRHKRFKNTADWAHVESKVFNVLGICDLDYSDIEEETVTFVYS